MLLWNLALSFDDRTDGCCKASVLHALKSNHRKATTTFKFKCNILDFNLIGLVFK